jgi:hypothetical protein
MNAGAGVLNPPGSPCPWQVDPVPARSLAPVDEALPCEPDVATTKSRDNQAVNPTFRRAKIAEHSG